MWGVLFDWAHSFSDDPSICVETHSLREDCHEKNRRYDYRSSRQWLLPEVGRVFSESAEEVVSAEGEVSWNE